MGRDKAHLAAALLEVWNEGRLIVTELLLLKLTNSVKQCSALNRGKSRTENSSTATNNRDVQL